MNLEELYSKIGLPIEIEPEVLSYADREIPEGLLSDLTDPGTMLLEWKKDNEFLQWVYGRTDIEYEYLPENTSLQRNMKKYLLQGGRIGAGRGILMKFD